MVASAVALAAETTSVVRVESFSVLAMSAAVAADEPIRPSGPKFSARATGSAVPRAKERAEGPKRGDSEWSAGSEWQAPGHVVSGYRSSAHRPPPRAANASSPATTGGRPQPGGTGTAVSHSLQLRVADDAVRPYLPARARPARPRSPRRPAPGGSPTGFRRDRRASAAAVGRAAGRPRRAPARMADAAARSTRSSVRPPPRAASATAGRARRCPGRRRAARSALRVASLRRATARRAPQTRSAFPLRPGARAGRPARRGRAAAQREWRERRRTSTLVVQKDSSRGIVTASHCARARPRRLRSPAADCGYRRRSARNRGSRAAG